MMNIREIANAFDMSVSRFAAYIGYSRQALYSEVPARNNVRGKAAIEMLDMRNHQLFAADQETAEKKFKARENAIRDLEKLLVKGGE